MRPDEAADVPPESYAIINGNNNGANPDNGGFIATLEACIAELPYHKLEIAPEDESIGLTWAEAYAACKAKAPEGEWRLPRMSELMWMYLNRAALEVEGFTPIGVTYYWSATEYVADASWYVYFINGLTNFSYKGSPRSVRCVREL